MAGPDSEPAGGLAPTLPSEFYRDPAILEREWERIFGRTWLCAGREDRIPGPGDYFTLPIGRESILILRDRENRPRAFFNVCRHRGTRLTDRESGRFDGTIVCPYHAWSYALDGRLIGTPHQPEENGFRRADYVLYDVALETWAGFLFINLAGREALPLAQQLGDIPGRLERYPLAALRTFTRMEHEVEANWKILMENYMECYHCPGVHPELCDLIPLYKTGRVDSTHEGEHAYFRKGASSLTRDGTTRRPFLSGLGDDEKRIFNGELVHPNLMLNILPDCANIRVAWPLSPSRTLIRTEYLFEPSTMERDDFDPGDVIDFTTLVARQDWEICERVQQGVSSRAHASGVYLPLEKDVGYFTRWFRERFETA